MNEEEYSLLVERIELMEERILSALGRIEEILTAKKDTKGVSGIMALAGTLANMKGLPLDELMKGVDLDDDGEVPMREVERYDRLLEEEKRYRENKEEE